jgi:hypothetical protein
MITNILTILFFTFGVVTVAAMVGVVAAVVLAWRAQRDIETADRQLPR